MQTTAENILNVTLLEPRQKHPTIFVRFDELAEGESLTIHNDHDPKPLYYQLLGERGNVFTWEYLEEGPEFWKIKIAKNKKGDLSPTIGELVAKDFRKAEIFKKYGLDFCCGGKKTLNDACEKKGLDVVQIEKELKEIEKISVLPSQNFDNWDLDFLATYIVNTHHKYVLQSMPVIFEYTQKVSKVHGDHHPEAIEIFNLFKKVNEELNVHMMKEENILFPYIKQLVTGMHTIEASPFGTIKNPIKMMENEHDAVGDLMEQIETLSDSFTPPADACTTFKL